MVLMWFYNTIGNTTQKNYAHKYYTALLLYLHNHVVFPVVHILTTHNTTGLANITSMLTMHVGMYDIYVWQCEWRAVVFTQSCDISCGIYCYYTKYHRVS